MKLIKVQIWNGILRNMIMQAYGEEGAIKYYFSYFSSKPCVVGTQKSRLNETILLSILNFCLNS